MTDIDELKPGKELDALVAEIMGRPFRKPTHGSCCTCQTCGYHYDDCQCGYSEDELMALAVYDTIKSDWNIEIGHGDVTEPVAEFPIGWYAMLMRREPDDNDDWPFAYGETLAIALCRVLLKAVVKEEWSD